MVEKHAIGNGIIGGLWILIPGLVIMIGEHDSIFSLAIEFALLIAMFPVIIFVVCVVASSTFTNTKEIMTICSITAVTGMFIMNAIVQIYFIIFLGLNDGTIDDIKLGDFFNFQQILFALFMGLFAGIISIVNPTIEQDVEVNPNLHPKPNWDPRIDKFRQELLQHREEISQLKKEMWQIRR